MPTKEDEAKHFSRHVAAAINEARAAARIAHDAFVRRAPRTTYGHIADVLWGAVSWFYRPSRRLRRVLKARGEMTRTGCGAWAVSDFTRGIVQDESITACMAGCQAACSVLRQLLPDEGEFQPKSFLI